MQQANSSSEQKPAEEQNGGRDDKGRFTKGNRGGPGNPFTRQSAKLRQAALDVVTEEDVRDILLAMKEKAKQGDVAAAKLVLAYTIGKPAAAPDPETLDRHELDTMIKNHVPTVAPAFQITEGMPLYMLMSLLREILPYLNDNKRKFVIDELTRTVIVEEDDVPASSGEEQSAPPVSAQGVPPAPKANGKRAAGKRSAATPEAPKDQPGADSVPSVNDELLRLYLRGNGQPAPIANGSNGKMPHRDER